MIKYGMVPDESCHFSSRRGNEKKGYINIARLFYDNMLY